MNSPKKYQALLDKFSSWLKKSSEEETRSMAEGVELLKEWIEAGLEVHQEEFYHSWQYFQRDLAYFYDSYQKEANESPYYLSVKDNIWQTLAEMTDRTQLEWGEFSSDLDHLGTYNAGEEVAFGRLKCQKCGELLEISHPQKIHPCFNCGHKAFTRSAPAP
ncbi:zinc ribbon-containing protein [Catenovulum sediminis]|uniref:Zinc ribbon-containing protein n=1 Tax=Catenovulum sediminis TaxID=1740262 RepID=A0ABV1RDF5_9ALTE